ncbi:MAG: bifunctional nicotinamide-nucleotide adenylyltransferase/Nudix hydroxylase [Candidatus Peribacteraceae bacterium]|nr:bifunctional nicotinamide-nucleotide adenylyltransferase/Nudix hydroxylase [Candidatus Peribacteraceae bacterium]
MSTQKQYDLIVYIGRFQPFHNGHLKTLKRASFLSKNALVLIGSEKGPRTIKNPWTYDERKEMIKNFSIGGPTNLIISGLTDYSYNDNKWITQVGEKVTEATNSLGIEGEPCIAVIGHDKDHSSYYLNYFPQWDYIEVPAFPSEHDVIDSTKIRQLMFTGHKSFTKSVLPTAFGSMDAVTAFTMRQEFTDLQKEWNFVEEYNKMWKAAPYPPTFVTVDAIVEQSGHILLIQRGEFPGKGLWAMPGGFINEFELLNKAVVRELREETGLRVPEKVLKGSITHKDVFDDPKRSTRGRTITHAYLFQLDNTVELPRVKGQDDAKKAKWFSLAEFEHMQPIMYEDHFSIIRNMLDRS